MPFIALFVAFPAKAGTGRMRVWRALRGLGAVTLRDGVYLLPEEEGRTAVLEEVAARSRAAGGTAEVYRLEGRTGDEDAGLRGLFDRTAEYTELVEEVGRFRAGLERERPGGLMRRMNALARRFDQIAAIDFYPGEARRQALATLEDARAAAAGRLSPGEPGAEREGVIPRQAAGTFRGRTWATRKNLWIDRMASAWLIRRHIDPGALFVWLEAPEDCRPDWIGFDFDGATFSHVGPRVTFETLLAAFGLEDDPALRRIGELVHFLDVGGVPVAEARGVETILAGLRQSTDGDALLLELVTPVFDGLQAALGQGDLR